MKKAGILLVFILAFTHTAFSQLPIGIKIGPSIGLTSPTSDYSGETSDFYAGTKYGMKSGVGFGAIGKVTLGPLNGRISVNYSSLSNSGPADLTSGPSTVEVKNSLLMFTLGTEFGFAIPFSPVKPYAGIDLLFSTISGSVNYQSTTGVPTGARDISSASRTGLGLALGSEIAFGTIIMDLSLRYNLHNLFGKEYIGQNSTQRIDAYTSVNDAGDPNYSAGSNSNHPVANNRSISTIQIQLGILFGF
jgi:hypothetical protein